ncbi:serine/threonine protein kinase [Brevibacillus choshinensis]|uniref:histidine kinase n=1 Tax=Brevibacillus choshinensis TaxID=54911 RepID=A0ABR5N826_BRECH|nr:AAA family ATPase [Brevibacillus choshinensis]KQL46794.1 serine/threonine protein kinase [Brevibacillus choshinensis]
MSGKLLVPGYRITEFVSNHVNMGVYRAFRIVDNLPVIIKTQQKGIPRNDSIWKLKHEYRILESIQSEAVEAIVELVHNDRETLLITEDHGGLPLSLLMKMRELSIREILTIALGVAHAMKKVHQSRVVHKDINPANILVHPDTFDVKLINFGLSTRLYQEYQSAMNPKEWQGNLRYVSPEQTGRMNRTVDYRSDFYSFGISLYEMLTGRPPFLSTDALELVHAHMARKPVPPNQSHPSIPAVLSDLVLKCLSKNVEDRYLSSSGLIADLEKCLDLLQVDGSINPFPLGIQDRTNQLHISEKLYGREQELVLLTESFEQISNGATRLVMLSGNAGVGKSALVREAQKAFLQGKGRFISGKFDQYKQSVPYSAILLAFQDLIRQILTGNERELHMWSETILEALQGLGQVIVDVIPQLEMIIGKQPVVPELPATEAKNRFQMVMQRFVRIWAKPEHPLVLFLDDLQWADPSSLFLIQEMISDLQVSHFLLLCAYREQEGSLMNPLMSALIELGSQNRILRQISLHPLEVDEIAQLLADTIQAVPESTQPLALIVHRKTAGNPFFTRQFLKSLYDKGLMKYVTDPGDWIWSLEEIEKLDTADNVADFLVERMRLLPMLTQKLLAYAACLGNHFYLHMVAKARNQKESETIRHIWPAVEEGLLYPLEGDSYLAYAALEEEDAAIHMKVHFTFLHDRIQQAAYSLLSEVEREMVHLKLGRMMRELTHSYESELLFEICNHMYQGAELIDDHTERMHVGHCHLLAGQRAKLSTAFDAALRFFRQGTEVLREEGWELNRQLAVELYTMRAEAEYLCNNFDTAESLFALVKQYAQTNAEQVRILEIQVHMYTSLAKFPLVVDIANQALQLLGVSIPNKPGKLDIIKEMWQIKRKLKGRKADELLYMPNVPDENYRMAMNIISYAGPSSYFVDMNWFALTILRVLHLSLVHGNDVASANGYTGYGIVQAAQFGKYQEGYDYGLLACSVADSFHDPIAMTKAYGAFAIMINHWRDHAKTNIPLLKKAIQHGLESGGNIYVAYNAHGLLEAMLYCGSPIDELRQQIGLYADLIRQLKVVDHDDRLLLLKQALHCFTRTEAGDPTAFCEENFDEEAYVKGLQTDGTNYKRYMYHYYKSMVHFLFGNYREAAEMTTEAEQWMETVSGQILVSEHVFIQTLALTGLYPQASWADKRKYAKKIKSNLSKMKKWATHCVENFHHKYLLMRAEWIRVSGDPQAATPFYEQAIQSAKKYGFLQKEAIAYELAAKHYLSMGMETVSTFYLSEAHFGYMQWGAVAKAQAIEAQNHFSTERIGSHQAITDITVTGHTPDMVDLMTVIKASQMIASEIKLDKLLATMLRTVMSNAGAQRGFIILKNESEWFIEAAGSIDEDIEILQSIPYEQGSLLSVATVNYVMRTEEILVLHEAYVEAIFFKDPYITKNMPKSILCAPLWQQGKMVGVVYLENNESTHVFNEGRTELLRLLFSQIATFIENARLYHQLEQWNQSLEKIVAERTDKIETLLRANKNLLNNAGQGFLSFCRNLLIHSEYSQECVRMFGRELAGLSIPELLYPDSKEDQVFIESLLNKYFELENGAQRELYLSLFPTEIMVNHLPLKVECKPIDEGSGEYSGGLMLILTDLSEQRALENKVEQEWQSLKMVVTVAISLDLFETVLQSFRSFVTSEWKHIWAEKGEGAEKLYQLISRLHQFKGDFSQFYLIHTPAQLHEMESILVHLAKNKVIAPDVEREIQSGIDSICSAIQQDLEIVKQQLGTDFLEKKEKAVSFSKDRWNAFSGQLTTYLQGEGQEHLLHEFSRLRNRPFTELLSRYDEYMAKVSARLDKRIYPLQIDAEDVWVDPQRFGNFVSCLVHVFSNALDHGIEDEVERVAQQKERWGTIRCQIKQEGSMLHLTISDDGKGVDLERLKMVGQEKGWDDTKSEQEWLNELFKEDVSTKIEVASELSGRGVGLSIVKREVERLGGTVDISTQKGKGTRFHFRIPLKEEESYLRHV